MESLRPLLRCALLIVGLSSGMAGARQPYPFSVSSERSGPTQLLVARNRGPAPISIRLTLTAAENVATSQPLPVYAVVRPYSEMTLLQIRAADPGRNHRFSTQSTYSVGNFHAEHDGRVLYRLPFASGRSFLVSQSADGPRTTHTAPDSEYAVDFTMPENTPVLAARAGVVIESESGNRLGGTERALLALANYVRILHDDGTVATYAHLAPGGVRVAPGQTVAAGSTIGLSGATGYTFGPHLHFTVQKLVRLNDGFAMQSLPIRFYAGNPPQVFEAKWRQMATAAYPDAGNSPALNEKRAVQAR